ncbi:MAG: hypothetical protein A3K76_03655 [Euryarchaeota archaeon RBG_13_57_23]|nr:MAG: hypothetical protein A3K76_03655 [Euryarchaeota archaeon RBG_13_57_23]
MRAYVEAYGCTLNFGESREVEDLLASKGWSIVQSPDEADLAVLATCVVVEKTERAMVKRLAELRTVPKLIVTGCMATACREKVQSLVPDAVFVGPGDLGRMAEVTRTESGLSSPSKVERESYGIVPIATGCLGNCSYCITRLARGELKSRRFDDIVGTIHDMVSTGPREIRLTAQDTAAYGADIGSSLPALVDGICGVPHDFRLRVGMMNPKNVLPKLQLVTNMYLQPKVFKFLHLPLQSASDRILSEMDRGYTLADFKHIVTEARAVSPAISFSTDLIVGYPGETEEDHEMNLRAVAETEPDIVNVTKFSSRPGTKAAMSGPKVVGWKAKDWSREITDLRFRVAMGRNSTWIGGRVVALSTEKGKKGSTIFRTDEYRQVVVKGVHQLGGFHTLRVTDATATYLRGELEDSE